MKSFAVNTVSGPETVPEADDSTIDADGNLVFYLDKQRIAFFKASNWLNFHEIKQTP